MWSCGREMGHKLLVEWQRELSDSSDRELSDSSDRELSDSSNNSLSDNGSFVTDLIKKAAISIGSSSASAGRRDHKKTVVFKGSI